MLVSINQPCYLPWCGLIERIARADIHVHLDDVQYSKGTFFNRNRIIDRTGREVPLAVPVKMHLGQTFREVAPANESWQEAHARSLRQCYPIREGNCEFHALLDGFYARRFSDIAELNITCTELLVTRLGITTPMVRSSELAIAGEASRRVVDICAHLGATAYYSPAGARDYINPDMFAAAGIELQFQNYSCVEYPQGSHAFVPSLAVVDPILRMPAPEALAVIKTGGGAPTAVPKGTDLPARNG